MHAGCRTHGKGGTGAAAPGTAGPACLYVVLSHVFHRLAAAPGVGVATTRCSPPLVLQNQGGAHAPKAVLAAAAMDAVVFVCWAGKVEQRFKSHGASK